MLIDGKTHMYIYAVIIVGVVTTEEKRRWPDWLVQLIWQWLSYKKMLYYKKRSCNCTEKCTPDDFAAFPGHGCSAAVFAPFVLNMFRHR